MKTAYTLAVIDDDGTVLAPSRAITLRSTLDQVQIGEGIEKSLSGFPDVDVYKDWRLPDGRTFKLWPCSPTPSDTIRWDEAIYVWERID